MDVQLSEKLVRLSEDRSRFGKGPRKPDGVGHCSNNDGDAIGVRVWWDTIKGVTKEYDITHVTDIWWTGEGSTECMAVAALLAKKLIGTRIETDQIYSSDVLGILDDELPGLYNPCEEGCVATAVSAFERAIWGVEAGRFDWTDLDTDVTGEAWDEVQEYLP